MDFRKALGALALSSLILTGCTGDGTETPAPETPAATSQETSPGASTSPSDTATEPIEHGEREEIPLLGDEETGIANDVKLADCGLEAGAVTATGTVTNSSDDARDIVVAVIWMGEDSSGSSLAVKVFQEAEVPAGESRDFTLETEIPADASRCVLNARSAPAGTLS